MNTLVERLNRHLSVSSQEKLALMKLSLVTASALASLGKAHGEPASHRATTLKGLGKFGGNVHAQSGAQQWDGVQGVKCKIPHDPTIQQCSTGNIELKYHLLEAEQITAAGSFSIQKSGRQIAQIQMCRTGPPDPVPSQS